MIAQSWEAQAAWAPAYLFCSALKRKIRKPTCFAGQSFRAGKHRQLRHKHACSVVHGKIMTGLNAPALGDDGSELGGTGKVGTRVSLASYRPLQRTTA